MMVVKIGKVSEKIIAHVSLVDGTKKTVSMDVHFELGKIAFGYGINEEIIEMNSRDITEAFMQKKGEIELLETIHKKLYGTSVSEKRPSAKEEEKTA